MNDYAAGYQHAMSVAGYEPRVALVRANRDRKLAANRQAGK